MNEKIFPKKLQAGDEIRIIAPSKTMAIISPGTRAIAEHRLAELGFELSFGQHIEEQDDFMSSSIQSRVDDLHAAFRDKKVKGVLTVLGGFNSNQLLRYIDWDLIRDNPKVFCGYSDITLLGNAMFTKTGLVSYSGPHYSSFGQELHFDYTLDYFKQCLMSEAPIAINASKQWSDDPWYLDQQDRKLIDNDGHLRINAGEATGMIVGGNVGTLSLLQGTEYWPGLKDTILFIEDDLEAKPHHFDRYLQSLIHLPDFGGVKGLVVGRFQTESNITNEQIIQIIRSKKELNNIPVLANVDFGHTDPMITFPIGGEARLTVDEGISKLEIIKH